MSDQAKLAGLMAVFEQQNADGTYRYADADVRHYLPYLVLAAKVPFAQLDPTVQRLVGQLVADAGLDLAKAPADVQRGIEAYYAAHPFNAQLHGEVLAFVRGALAGGDEQGRAAVAALLGGERTTGVLGGGARPAGTVPGGPLGRLAMMTPTKKR